MLLEGIFGAILIYVFFKTWKLWGALLLIAAGLTAWVVL